MGMKVWGQGTRMLIGMIMIFAAILVGAVRPAAAIGPKKFTLINATFDGEKIWLPSVIIVQQWDEVELTLINKLDAPHGFTIDVFGIESVIAPKSKSTVTFTARTPGAHPYSCQLHPQHIGGQIYVLAK